MTDRPRVLNRSKDEKRDQARQWPMYPFRERDLCVDSFEHCGVTYVPFTRSTLFIVYRHGRKQISFLMCVCLLIHGVFYFGRQWQRNEPFRMCVMRVQFLACRVTFRCGWRSWGSKSYGGNGNVAFMEM